MNVTNQTKNNIIRALLDADEDDDADSASLSKEMTTLPDELLREQLATLLPEMIKKKEKYLGSPFIKSWEFTNPNGDTYVFGEFGFKPGSRANAISTLLYLSPLKGWVPDPGWSSVNEDEMDDDDFKEVHGEPPDEKPAKYLPIGSYSHGTMRPEHVVPRLLHWLEWADIAVGAEQREEYDIIRENIELEPDNQDFQDNLNYFCWETLFDKLNEYAPPYTSVGSHEGDGSDYGCWVQHDSLDELAQDPDNGEVLFVRAGEPLVFPDPEENDYVCVVDRAGDYTALYNGQTGRQYWSI